MSGSSGEMGNLLKQAQRMQQAMDAAREELKSTTVEASGANGGVRVTVSGDGRIQALELSEAFARSGDAAHMQSHILAVAQAGIERATKLREERLSRVTGGLNLPGLL